MSNSQHEHQIIDVFLFNDEEGPLLARFLELSTQVDHFVGIEGSLTHAGKPRAPMLEASIDRLGLPREKFTCLMAALDPNDLPFDRDRKQRDYARSFLLEEYGPDTIILFSDVDEVPRGAVLQEACETIESGYRFVHFAQLMSLGFLNNFETSGRLMSYAGEYPGVSRAQRKWLGTVGFARKELDSGMTLSEIRYPARKVDGRRLDQAGWHFSFCGGKIGESLSVRLSTKLQASAHTEFSHLTNASGLEARLLNGKDIFRRRFVRFSAADSSLFLTPAIVSDDRLANLILRKPKNDL